MLFDASTTATLYAPFVHSYDVFTCRIHKLCRLVCLSFVNKNSETRKYIWTQNNTSITVKQQGVCMFQSSRDVGRFETFRMNFYLDILLLFENIISFEEILLIFTNGDLCLSPFRDFPFLFGNVQPVPNPATFCALIK